MQQTQSAKFIDPNKAWYTKEIAAPIAVTLASMGIALAGADRFGLSLGKKIVAAGVPAWGAATYYLIKDQLNEFERELQKTLRATSICF